MRLEDIGEAWALAYERARGQGAEDRGNQARLTRLRTLSAQKELISID